MRYSSSISKSSIFSLYSEPIAWFKNNPIYESTNKPINIVWNINITNNCPVNTENAEPITETINSAVNVIIIIIAAKVNIVPKYLNQDIFEIIWRISLNLNAYEILLSFTDICTIAIGVNNDI